MKKFLKATVLGMGVTLFASSSVYALPDSAFYVGTLLGDSSLELRAKSIDDTDNPGKAFEVQDSQAFSVLLTGGMRFTDSIGMELQFMSSLQADTVFGAVRVNGKTHSPMDVSSSAMGAYAFFQGGDEAFFKVRVGLAQAQADFETDFAKASYSTPGLSYGVSIGQKMGGIGAFELAFMQYPQIEVPRADFAKNYGSTTPFSDRTTVENGLRSEIIALGYVFQF